MNIVGFEVYEKVAFGITNPGNVTRITGTPEDMERLIAFCIQSGLEVAGITEEEKDKRKIYADKAKKKKALLSKISKLSIEDLEKIVSTIERKTND
jgi:hypothetical protein